MTHYDPTGTNAATIHSYDNNIAEYAAKDSRDARKLEYWPSVQKFLDLLTTGEEIFEIGSGIGTDAALIERHGVPVMRSDVTTGFIEHLRSKGFEAQHYNVLEGPLPKRHSAVFANAVLLHFTAEQFATALKHIRASLLPNGLFCFGMKLGDFEGWREKGLSEKRYFKFWHVDDLLQEGRRHGFEPVFHDTLSNGEFGMLCFRAAGS